MPHPDSPATKPLLRGVLHEIAAAFAVLVWAWLLHGARTAIARHAANAYGASLFTMFATSALYHRPHWQPRARQWMRRADHSAIFILIAGTFTPFCCVIARSEGFTFLIVTWICAALGVCQAMLWVQAPKPLIAVIYLVMGWMIGPKMPMLAVTMGGGAVALIAVGGIIYSAGALVYALRRPNPFPRVFGYHEIFHALIIVAAGVHFIAVCQAISFLNTG